MKGLFYVCIFSCFLIIMSLWGIETQSAEKVRQISWEEYLDKVEGGWLGQMIGVTFGADTELKFMGKIIPFDLEDYTRCQTKEGQHKKDYIKVEPNGAPDQDDIYIELLFLHCIKTYGIDVTARKIAEEWLETIDYERVWHANKAAHANFKKGIWPPESGKPKYNAHADDIDFQIEADLFGLISPGMPHVSNQWADKVGHIMNYGDGVYGGMFVAGMYTIAFFEKDPEKIVQGGLDCIPPESDYAKLIRDIIGWHKEYKNWMDTWKELEKKWGETDSCPYGRNHPFNIDAKMNGGYIAIGLLYGEGDFYKTMNISMRCGQDSDCNPSNAVGILGCSLGASSIPLKWKAPMKDFVWNKSLSGIYPSKIKRKRIVETTAEIGKKMVVLNGGSLSKDKGKIILNIPVHQPKPPEKLEKSIW